MDIFYSQFGARLVFILGTINLVSGLAVLLSCRCIPQISGRLMQHAFYKRFYKAHCYIWWVFWSSVIIHAVFAIVRTEVPF